MLSYPPSSHAIAITLNTLDAAQLGVVTVSSSILGRHLIHRVMKLGRKPDTILNLIFGEIPLDIGKTLAEQGIQRDSECACLWTEVSSADRNYVVRCYCSQQSLSNRQLLIWETSEDLIFEDDFNQTLEDVAFRGGLKHLYFGRAFNQSLENSDLPSSLLTLSFGHCFNQSLRNVQLPSGLQSLTFGSW